MAFLCIMQGLAENQLCHMTSLLRTRPSTNIIASDNIQFLYSPFSALQPCDFFMIVGDVEAYYADANGNGGNLMRLIKIEKS